MKIDKYANFVKISFKNEKEFNDYVELLQKIQEDYIKEDMSELISVIRANKMGIEGEIITLIPNGYADIFCYLSYKLALVLTN